MNTLTDVYMGLIFVPATSYQLEDSQHNLDCLKDNYSFFLLKNHDYRELEVLHKNLVAYIDRSYINRRNDIVQGYISLVEYIKIPVFVYDIADKDPKQVLNVMQRDPCIYNIPIHFLKQLDERLMELSNSSIRGTERRWDITCVEEALTFVGFIQEVKQNPDDFDLSDGHRKMLQKSGITGALFSNVLIFLDECYKDRNCNQKHIQAIHKVSDILANELGLINDHTGRQ